VRARATADFAQHAHTKIKMGDRNRFGDLKVNVVIVRKDGVIRAHRPQFFQLVGMQVEKDRRTGAQGNGDLADHPPEPSNGVFHIDALNEGGGRKAGDCTPDERLVGEQRARVQMHDGLEHRRQILGLHLPAAEVRRFAIDGGVRFREGVLSRAPCWLRQHPAVAPMTFKTRTAAGWDYPRMRGSTTRALLAGFAAEGALEVAAADPHAAVRIG